MRIMFFTLSLCGGGAERVLATLSNEMSKRHEVSIVTVHNIRDEYGISDRIKRIKVDKKRWEQKSIIRNKIRKLSLCRIIRLIRIIKKENPDVVITFLPLPSIYITLAKYFSKRINEIPVILSERGDPEKEYRNCLISLLIKKLYRRANGFVFQTNDAKSYYSTFLKCKTTIIENPIDEAFLRCKLPKNRRKTIVSCGRLEEQKNYKLLIDAFSDILRECPDYTLEIYGEGSQRSELLALAEKMKVKNSFSLKGRVDNLIDRIVDAGIFVLSSNYEGMPNALMEAMALGLPCISTDCPVGGPRALISDGENGLLIEVGNKEQLVNSVIKVATDRKFALKLSKNSMETAKDYTVEKIVDRWFLFIQKVINSGGIL